MHSTLNDLIRSVKNGLRKSPIEQFESEQWRVELKFPQQSFTEQQARIQLLGNSAGFLRTFPTRTINNIYFDSVDHMALRENIDGIGNRAKVRLRWYGKSSLAENPIVEIKTKSKGAGRKLQQSVGHTFDVTGLSWSELRTLMSSNISPEIKRYMDVAQSPMLFNTYTREYYESFDRSVRATIDTEIRSTPQLGPSSPKIDFHAPILSNFVVELKASVDEEPALRKIAGSLRWRVDKHSKYVRGVLPRAL